MPPGALAEALIVLGDSQAQVHQDCGMISVQLDVSMAEASVRLRAYADAEGRVIADVARDVVGRDLRLDR